MESLRYIQDPSPELLHQLSASHKIVTLMKLVLTLASSGFLGKSCSRKVSKRSVHKTNTSSLTAASTRACWIPRGGVRVLGPLGPESMRAIHSRPRWQVSMRSMLQSIQKNTRSEITQDKDGSSSLQSTQGDKDGGRGCHYAKEKRGASSRAAESKVGRPRHDERVENKVPWLYVRSGRRLHDRCENSNNIS